ncbi:MAG TPA: peroxiredoxin-like family protein [bacterium]|nr:peroxiredoxin-like family protein [bacterium]
MEKTLVLKKGDVAPDFTIADSQGAPFSLADYRGGKSVVLVFLRYAGCPICQLALADLKESYPDFAAKNVEVAAFVQSPRETLDVKNIASAFPFRLIPDPDGRIYEQYGVGSGDFTSLIAPKTLIQGVKATLQGHFQGKMEGNQWQLPGDFVIDTEGKIKFAHIGKNMGDNLPPNELLKHI